MCAHARNREDISARGSDRGGCTQLYSSLRAQPAEAFLAVLTVQSYSMYALGAHQHERANVVADLNCWPQSKRAL